MTRRIRCDCKLKGLPVERRVKVDAWLFEEGWTYEEVVEGCLREFGLGLPHILGQGFFVIIHEW